MNLYIFIGLFVSYLYMYMGNCLTVYGCAVHHLRRIGGGRFEAFLEMKHCSHGPSGLTILIWAPLFILVINL
jgi:hypothetical protein